MTVRTGIVIATRTVVVIGIEILSTRTFTKIKGTGEIEEIDIGPRIGVVTNLVIADMVVVTRGARVIQDSQGFRVDPVLNELRLPEVVTVVIVASPGHHRVVIAELVFIVKIGDGLGTSLPLDALKPRRQLQRRKSRRLNLRPKPSPRSKPRGLRLAIEFQCRLSRKMVMVRTLSLIHI